MSSTLTIGPEHGSLMLHTGVEGKAAKAGHRLAIAVTDWSATVTFEGDDPTSVSLRAAVGSIQVVSGEGGLKPLSDRDRATIVSSALETLAAAKFPEATFASNSVKTSADGYDLDGEATLRGTTGPVRASLRVQQADGNATVDATVPVVQTEFGIKPYKGMMGALRVTDQAEIRLAVTVPAT